MTYPKIGGVLKKKKIPAQNANVVRLQNIKPRYK